MNEYIQRAIEKLNDIAFQLSIAKYPLQKEVLLDGLKRQVKALDNLLNGVSYNE